MISTQASRRARFCLTGVAAMSAEATYSMFVDFVPELQRGAARPNRGWGAGQASAKVPTRHAEACATKVRSAFYA
jgi:hypothetical protein